MGFAGRDIGDWWFQSTPDLINRENLRKIGVVPDFNMFQSTPDLINRENRNSARNPCGIIFVSIHSRFN